MKINSNRSYELDRKKLYRFPWSKPDNPGGWIEVTDECNLSCPFCYRHRIEGHRSLDELKEEIIRNKEAVNCDRIGIAGGEPLLYPQILEVVEFIVKNDMKPLLLTNGILLTKELAADLRDAGLVKYHFHIDSEQKRPGWKGKNETQMNDLRQYYADLVWDVGGVQAGYNITISRKSLSHLPAIVNWARMNLHKVAHISLIAKRAIPVDENLEYYVNGEKIDASIFQHHAELNDEISITAEEMYRGISETIPDFRPAVYLNGTADVRSYKFLVTIGIGYKNHFYGLMGSKTVEFSQIFYHLFKGRYFDFLRSTKVGRKVLFAAIFDKEIRKTLRRYLAALITGPIRIFNTLYAQSISIQQPNEFHESGANLCDSCVNMMLYKGELIPSCRLDEYRMFGGPIMPVFSNVEEKSKKEKSLTKQSK